MLWKIVSVFWSRSVMNMRITHTDIQMIMRQARNKQPIYLFLNLQKHETMSIIVGANWNNWNNTHLPTHLSLEQGNGNPAEEYSNSIHLSENISILTDLQLSIFFTWSCSWYATAALHDGFPLYRHITLIYLNIRADNGTEQDRQDTKLIWPGSLMPYGVTRPQRITI